MYKELKNKLEQEISAIPNRDKGKIVIYDAVTLFEEDFIYPKRKMLTEKYISDYKRNAAISKTLRGLSLKYLVPISIVQRKNTKQEIEKRLENQFEHLPEWLKSTVGFKIKTFMSTTFSVEDAKNIYKNSWKE